MSARLAVASTAPQWRLLDCLSSVEQRCRKLIHPSLAASTGTFNDAARAADYHLQAGGRRIRARLALDASFQLGLSARTAIVIASTCELLHNASLVHDDLQDRDALRRGADAVWKGFGDDTAICTGDLLLSSAYAALADLDDPAPLSQMLTLVHVRTAATIQGQSADIAHRNKPVTDIPTYLKIVAGKSGALLSLPLELALIAAGHAQWTHQACDAAAAFAIGYQIADDLDDIDKDRRPLGTPHALNIALLLQQNTASVANEGAVEPCAEVRSQCLALAQQHLRLAAERAAVLPHQSGQLLTQLANELNATL